MQIQFCIASDRCTVPGCGLIHEMRAYLSSNCHDQALALDSMAVRILVEREGSLLLDLLHLVDEFFQLHAAQGGFFRWREHKQEEANWLPRSEQEIGR